MRTYEGRITGRLVQEERCSKCKKRLPGGCECVFVYGTGFVCAACDDVLDGDEPEGAAPG